MKSAEHVFKLASYELPIIHVISMNNRIAVRMRTDAGLKMLERLGYFWDEGRGYTSVRFGKRNDFENLTKWRFSR